MKSPWYVCLIFGLASFASTSLAVQGVQTFTIDGKLKKTGTQTALIDPNVKLEIQIIDPSAQCLLYYEVQFANTATSNGYLNIQVGSGLGDAKRALGDPGLTMNQVFSNSAPVPAIDLPGQTCPLGMYTPSAKDGRLFRLTVTPSLTGVPDVLADTMFDAVPAAMVAESADTIQGFGPAQLLRVNTVGAQVLSQSNLENIFTNSNYNTLVALLNGTSALYNKPAANGTTVLPAIAAPATPAAGQVWYDAGQIKYYDGAATQTVTTGSGSQWTTSGANIYYNTGNVGVGTATPAYPLDVAGNAALGATGAGGILVLRRPDDGTAQASIGWGNGGTSITEFAIRNVGAAGTIAFYTNDGAVAERMKLDNAGNLGIGVAAPNRVLHIAGPMRINPTALPVAPAAGDLAFDSGDTNKLKYYDGVSWQTVGTGSLVSSFNSRTGAVVPAANDYTWAQINKTTSSLADLTTRSASDLDSGTLADARLSANVALKNGTNAFTAANSFAATTSMTVATSTSEGLVIKSSDNGVVKNIVEIRDSADAVKASIRADGVPTAATDLTTKSYVDTAIAGIPAGVTSFNTRTGAVTPAANDYTWAQVDKSTSSFADITTRSASDINSGTLADGRLSANVPLKDGANAFTNANTVTVPTTTATAVTLKSSDDNNTKNILEVQNNAGTATASIRPDGVPTAATDLTTKSYVDTKVSTDIAAIPLTNYVLKAGDTMTGALNLPGNGLNVAPAALSGAATAGMIAIDSGDGNQLKYYNGTAWQTLGVSGAGVTTFNTRAGAVVPAANDYTWAQIDKSTSSFADITTRSASDINAGTLADARLSANVALKDQANTFSVGGQQITNDSDATKPLVIRATATQTATLTEWQTSGGATIYGLAPGGVPTASTDLADKGYVDTAISSIPAGVTSFNTRTGAVTPAANDYTWAQVDKSTSSFADITTRSASDINSGTLADGRLSANVPLRDAANTFTNTNTVSVATTTNSAAILKSSDDNNTKNIFEVQNNAGTATASIRPDGVPTAATDLTTKSYVDNKVSTDIAAIPLSNYVLKAGDTMTGQLVVPANGLKVTAGALSGAATTGMIAVDSGAGNALKWYDGAAWQTVGTSTGGVTSFNTRTGAVVPAANDYTFAQIDKTTSSLADLTTRSAGDLSSGTLADARLSANVALKDQANTFSVGGQQITNDSDATKPLVIRATATQTATLTEWQTSGGATIYGLDPSGVPTASTDLADKGYVDTAISGIPAGVTSFNTRTGAVTPAANDYTWAQVDKSTSSFADITTRSASDINAGILADARLSANVPLKDATNTFTNTNTVSVATATKSAAILKSTDDDNTENILEIQNNAGTATASIRPDGVPTAATDLTTKSYVDAAVAPMSNYVLKAGDTMTGPLVNNSNSASTAVAVTQSGAGYAATFTGGNVGVGTASPLNALHVEGNTRISSESAGAAMVLYGGNPGAIDSQIVFRTSHGSVTAPTTMVDGDSVGSIYGAPHNGVGYIHNALAGFIVDTAAMGTGFRVTTGTGGVRNERLRISSTGNVGIGTSTPGRLLDVAGPIRVQATALPGAPAVGDIAIDSADGNKLKWYDGAWQTVGTSSGGVTSFNTRSGAVTPAANDYTWAQIDKTTSSFADITTRSASDINAGTLADARLSANVALKDQANTFSVGGQQVTNTAAATRPLVLKAAAAQSASLTDWTDSADAVIYGLAPGGVPTAATDLADKGYVDTAVAAVPIGNYVLKAGDTMTGALVNNTNSASTALAITQAGAGYAATFMGGNVGIGTTAPSTLLHLNSAVATATTIQSTTDNQASLNLYNSNRNWRIINDSSGGSGAGKLTFYDGTAGANRLTLDGSGNVGIGTTSPGRLLHVAGPMRLQAAALPGTPAVGDIAIDSADGNKLKWYDGAWQTVGTSSGGVTTFNTRSGAVTPAANDYTWAQIDKTTSSFADITTRSASDINAGTLADARLSANVALKDQANVFSVGGQQITNTVVGTRPLVLKAAAGQTASLTDWIDDADAVIYGLAPGGVPTAATDLADKGYVDTSVGNYVLKAGDTMTGQLVLPGNGLKITAAALSGAATTGMVAVDSGDANKLKYYDGAAWITLGAATGDILNGGNTTGAEITIGTNDANKLSFETGDAKAMTIDATGQVGIGITTPTAKFEVSGGDAKINTLTVGLGAGAVASNTAMGLSALAANTTGSNNTAIGKEALMSNTTNSYITAIGQGALRSSNAGTTGSVAVGSGALYNSTSGHGQVAVGTFALINSTTGNQNTGIGHRAMQGATTASNNTSLGYQALQGVTTGDGNTGLGHFAGANITTGANNIIIGRVNAISATENNQLNIGNIIFGTGIEGTGATLSTGNIGIGTTAPGRLLHVAGPMRVQPAALPGTGVAGDIAIDSGDANKLKFYNGSAWQTLGTGTGNGDFLASGTVPMTGTFKATDGTAAAPSITFNNDQNTGMYSYGADDIGFASNGAVAFRILGGGSSAYLSAGRLRAASGSVSQPALGFENDPNTGIFTNVADTLQFTNNGAETMRIAADGKVGIGTTAPDTPLVVASTGPAQLRIHRDSSVLNATNNIYMSALDSTSTVTSYAAISSIIRDATDGSEDGALTISTRSAGAALTERVRFDENGNVGIGTTNPGAKLEVVGNEVFRGDDGSYQETQLEVNSGGAAWHQPYLTLRRARGTSAAKTYPLGGDALGMISFRNHNTNEGAGITAWADEAHSATDSGTGLSIFTVPNDTITALERIRIASGGNVGIGTTNPGRLLHVNGPMRVQPAALPTGATGDIAIDSGDSNKLKYYDGSAWVTLGSGGATTDASLLTSGTLADARLSSNVVLKDQANVFSVGGQQIINTAIGTRPLVLKAAAGQTASLTDWTDSADAVIYGLDASGVPTAATDLADKGYVDTKTGDYVLKAGDTMTGPLAIPVGSAAAPGLTFASNTNTGIYSQGTNVINFASNGNLKFYINSSSVNVNAGQSFNSPTSYLPQIYGATTAAADIRIDGANNASKGNVLLSTGGGNVGIGTTNPSATVDVATTAIAGRETPFKLSVSDASGDVAGFKNATATNGYFSSAFYGSHVTSSARSSLAFQGMTTAANDTGSEPMVFFVAQRHDGDPVNGTFSALTTRPLFRFANQNTSVMEVMASGNVGVGTTNPARLLHVNGPIRVQAAALPTGAAGDIAVDSGDSNKLKYYDGSAWVTLGSGGGTTDASLLTSGTLADARLSSNVALKDQANVFSVGGQQITNTVVGTRPLVLKAAAGQTASLTDWIDSADAVIYGLAPGGVPTAATDLADKGYVDTSVGNYVLKAGDTMTGALVNNTNSASTALKVAQAGAGHAATFIGGNVGIGTTNPGVRLDVLSSAASSTVLRVQNSSGNDMLQVYEQSSGAGQLILRNGASAQKVRLDANGNTWFDGGNVGIGTTNPAKQLEVSKAQGGAHLYVTNRGDDTSANPDSSILLRNYWATMGAGSAIIGSFTARGSSASPTPVLTNMPLLSLQARGYAEAGFGADQVGASIDFVSSANWGNSNTPADMIFKTAPTGTWGTAERMRITYAGNVGIGTSTPARLLHVAGPMRVQAAALPTGATGDIAVDSGDSNKLKYYNGSAWVELGSGGGSSQWTTTGSDIYYTTGKVGIGINAPTDPLHVVGTSMFNTSAAPVVKIKRSDDNDNTEAVVTLQRNRSTSTAPGSGFGAKIKLDLEGFTSGSNVGAGAIDWGWEAAQTDDTTTRDGFLAFRTTEDNGSESSGGTEKMRITSAGNLGIGTTNPTQKLEIVGSVGDSNAPIQMIKAGATDAQLGFGVNTNYAWIQSHNTKPLYINELANDTIINKAGGNVGIGTTAPASKLYVVQPGSESAVRATTAAASYFGGEFFNTDGGGNVFVKLAGSQTTNIALTARAGTDQNFRIGNDGTQLRINALNDAANTHVPMNIETSTTKFFISGSEKARIDSTGNVGIGTTAPTARAHVAGTLRIGDGGELCSAVGAGGLKWNGTAMQFCNGTAWADIAGASGGDFKSDGTVSMTGTLKAAVGSAALPGYTFSGMTGTGMFETGTNILGFSTAGAERARILANGNVGIGTASPANPLDVVKTQNAISSIGVTNLDTLGSALATFAATSNVGTIHFGASGSGASGLGIITTNIANGLKLRSYGNGPILFETGNGSTTEIMRISGAGNVGIGTTNPTTKLEVVGPTNAGASTWVAAFRSAPPAGYSSNIIIENNSGAGNFKNQVAFNAGGAAKWSMGNDLYTTGVQNFFIWDAVAGANRFYIDSGGDVGIGTTATTEKLVVNGNVLAAAYLYSSDSRLKKDIVPLEHSLEKILSLTTVNFDWRAPLSPEADRRQIGLIAQNVQAIYPEAVTADEDGFLRVNYPALIAPVIDAIRDLYKMITGVDAKVAALETKVQTLEEKNKELEARLQRIEDSLNKRQPAGK